MAINPIRQKLKSQKTFNPFHDDFNEELVDQEIKRRHNDPNLTREDQQLLATASTTFTLNLAFKEVYQHLRQSFGKTNLTYNELLGFSLAFRNRNCKLIDEHNNQKYASKTEHHFEDNFRNKLTSSDPTIGKIDAAAALETEVDSFNIIINYLRYFKEKLPLLNPDLPKVQSIEQLKSQALAATFYYILKSAYEDAVWRDGFAFLNHETRVLTIEFDDAELLRKFRIGIYRLQRNALAGYIVGKSLVEKIGFEFSKHLNPYKNQTVRIGEVRVSQGYLKYNLTDGHDKFEVDTELSDESSLIAYYSYLQNVPLPNLPGLDIRKMLGLFSLLIHLFRRALHLNITDKGVYKKSDFFRYPFRIKREHLKSYVLRRSTLPEADIESFFDVVVNNGRINLWDKQFIENGDDLYFLLLPMVSPNILYLIDFWLEEGGYNLDARGKFFEKHIKASLSEILAKKGYTHLIPQKSKLLNSKNKFEEIDVLINLKSIVIIGEVKCIRYPFEPREIANALTRLEQGAEQIKRKMQFVIDNAGDLHSDIGSIEGKEIVPLLITNYPIFTSHHVAEIPIVDFYLLEAYFGTGKITDEKIVTYNGSPVSSETTYVESFYTNEDECCQNFKEKMKKPPSVAAMYDQVEITYNKISPDGLNYQVFVQAGEFKEQPYIKEGKQEISKTV